MWVAREENGLLRLYTKKPYRYDGGIWRIPNDGDCITISDEEYPQFKSITWKDEPIEVMVESLEELRKGQIELKNVYHELLEYKTKQNESLTRVFRGVALEDVANIIKDLEENVHRKYKMVGNPYAEQNMRNVSIASSMMQSSDNSLREYIVDDKVVVTIYVRRNDFNTADILISDLGEEYNTDLTKK